MVEKIIRREILRFFRLNNFEGYAIETMGTALGMADILYAGRGNSGVIELKIAHKKGLKIKLDYRPGQRVFLREFHKLSGYAFVLTYLENKMYLIDGRGGFPGEYSTIQSFFTDCVWNGVKFDEKFLYNVTIGSAGRWAGNGYNITDTRRPDSAGLRDTEDI